MRHPESSPFGEAAALVEQRANTYGLLARMYRKEIDAPFLAELKGMRFPAATGNEHVDAGYRALVTYLSNTWENSLEELAIDYVRTFLGDGVDAFAAAYPFESVYTSEKRLLMQDARDEVLAVYRSMGLEKDSSWKESEDHLAVELELMQVLCLRTVAALRKGDEEESMRLLATQRHFLEDHIASWTPMLTADMRRFAKCGLYQGLADLTDGFIEIDQEFLADLLEDEMEEKDCPNEESEH